MFSGVGHTGIEARRARRTRRRISLDRTFRDNHTEEWWLWKAKRAPYGPHKAKQIMIAAGPESCPASDISTLGDR